MTEDGSTFHPNQEFYDRIAGSYDAIAHSSERQATEEGLAALAVGEGDRVLEIGFGTGHALVALGKAVGETGKVYGVDVSEGMRDVAAKRLEKEGLAARVELDVGAVPPLRFDDGTLDAVFLSFTLELYPLETIPAVLAEVRRVLRPGGRCGIVSMAIPEAPKEDSALEKVYVWMHRHFPHIVDCQPIAAESELAKAGFSIQHDERLDIWTLPVAVVVGESP